jgi:hypothetical protein
MKPQKQFYFPKVKKDFKEGTRSSERKAMTTSKSGKTYYENENRKNEEAFERRTDMKQHDSSLQHEDDSSELELELDPFQNFRFRRRPPDMQRFSRPLSEFGTNFDLSKFENRETNEADDDDEAELQQLSRLTALNPPTTFRPFHPVSQIINVDIENNNFGGKRHVDAWQRGLQGKQFEKN